MGGFSALAAFGTILHTVLLSAIPLLELRVGIPYGVANGLHPAVAAAAGIVGNLAQIPFILLLLRGLRLISPHVSLLTSFFAWCDANARKRSHLALRYGWLGIGLMLAIPIPGTGLWTGAIVGHILGLPVLRVAMGLSFGVFLSGVLFGLASAGVLELLAGLGFAPGS